MRTSDLKHWYQLLLFAGFGYLILQKNQADLLIIVYATAYRYNSCLHPQLKLQKVVIFFCIDIQFRKNGILTIKRCEMAGWVTANELKLFVIYRDEVEQCFTSAKCIRICLSWNNYGCHHSMAIVTHQSKVVDHLIKLVPFITDLTI